MRFAIVESGGKQYRVIEGRAIEVDRLPVEAGKKFDIERILLMSDGDDVLVGTPLVSDILVKIEGIGPKVAKALNAAGISTFEGLANTSVEDIQKILSDADLKMMDATSWPAQAKLAAEGDWGGLQQMQDELSGGRKASPAKKPAATKKSTATKSSS